MNAYQQVISNLESRITDLEAGYSSSMSRAEDLKKELIELRLLRVSLIKATPEEPPTTEPEEAKTLRLEVGKRYVRRDGYNTDPLISDGEWFHDPSEPTYLYREDGHFYPHTEDWRDLVAEYVEPPKEWEFFYKKGKYFWAYPKNSNKGVFFTKGNPEWHDSAQSIAETIRFGAAPIPNLPPGIPMP